MAGSKIFLEPILSETVNGVDGAIQDVINVLDPVPEKIDEQIEKLAQVVNVVGASLSNISVADGSDFSFNIIAGSGSKYKNLAIPNNVPYGAVTTNTVISSTFTTYVDGTFKINIPAYRVRYSGITTGSGDDYNITISYELTKNGTTVKSGTILNENIDNSVEGDIGSNFGTTATELSNIACSLGDIYVLTLTMTLTGYGGEGYIAANLWASFDLYVAITAGYRLVEIATDGIVVTG